MIVEATAPTRLDLAGGTLDVYPIYLFVDGGITVNAGIELRSHVRIETRSDREVHLISQDTGARLSAPSAPELPVGRELDLVARVVKFYSPRTGVDVITRSTAPHGSGLGASSSLLIALSKALDALNGTGLSDAQLIDYGASLEAQSIGIPTGKQDYYGALYGGVNAIWFEVANHHHESLLAGPQIASELENRIVLSFTGEARASAASNWSMLKAYIDRQGDTPSLMEGIKRIALQMRDALLSNDWDGLAELVGQEWQHRRRLAEGVATVQTDRVMAAAQAQGALASKICGAGGGGCMITVVHPDRRQAVISAIQQNGAQHLPFQVARRGATVQVLETV